MHKTGMAGVADGNAAGLQLLRQLHRFIAEGIVFGGMNDGLHPSLPVQTQGRGHIPGRAAGPQAIGDIAGNGSGVDEVAFGKLSTRPALKSQVHDGTEQKLRCDRHAGLAITTGQQHGENGPDRVTAHGDAGAIRLGARGEPKQGRGRVVELAWKASLRGAAIPNRHDGDTRRSSQPAAHAVMGVDAAGHQTAAMEKQENGTGLRNGSIEPHRDAVLRQAHVKDRNIGTRLRRHLHQICEGRAPLFRGVDLRRGKGQHVEKPLGARIKRHHALSTSPSCHLSISS